MHGAGRGAERRDRDRRRCYHSLALKSDGSVLAWGCSSGNDYGQCTVPAGAPSGVTAIAAGDFHSLALKSDGSVLAWGCGGTATSASARCRPGR